MFKRYLKFLNKLVDKLDNWDKITSFIKNNKWKILAFFFLIRGLEVSYMVYDRGQCINCNTLSKETLEEIDGDIEKLIEYSNDNLIYVPYTDIITYLSDLLIPLLITWGVLFILISIFYVTYKILSKIYSNLSRTIGNKMQKRYEESLKKQTKK